VEPIELIQEAIHERGMQLLPDALDRFRLYQDQLIKWNQKINLISKKDETRIVTRHFLESIGILTVSHFSKDIRVLDLGTGGGFPGLPMKIIRPDLKMILVEATQKKVNFLKQLVDLLQLDNVDIIPERIESVNKQIQPVDIVVSRAVANIDLLIRWSLPCMRAGGKLITVKGVDFEKEMRLVKAKLNRYRIQDLRVERFNPFSVYRNLLQSYVFVITVY
jgi:16S rRNA (guanine527-N7)-methyltransferase